MPPTLDRFGRAPVVARLQDVQDTPNRTTRWQGGFWLVVAAFVALFLVFSTVLALAIVAVHLVKVAP